MRNTKKRFKLGQIVILAGDWNIQGHAKHNADAFIIGMRIDTGNELSVMEVRVNGVKRVHPIVENQFHHIVIHPDQNLRF
jgi:hypothetical protein